MTKYTQQNNNNNQQNQQVLLLMRYPSSRVGAVK